MRTDDPIRFVRWDSTFNGRNVGMGSDPADNPAFVQLETGELVTDDGVLQASQGHSDYPRAGDDGAVRTTVHNVAAVVSGLPGNAEPER